MDQQLLTVAEVARMTRFSRWTIHRLIKAEELEVTKVGRSIRIKAESLGDLIARSTVTASEETR